MMSSINSNFLGVEKAFSIQKHLTNTSLMMYCSSIKIDKEAKLWELTQSQIWQHFMEEWEK